MFCQFSSSWWVHLNDSYVWKLVCGFVHGYWQNQTLDMWIQWCTQPADVEQANTFCLPTRALSPFPAVPDWRIEFVWSSLVNHIKCVWFLESSHPNAPWVSTLAVCFAATVFATSQFFIGSQWPLVSASLVGVQWASVIIMPKTLFWSAFKPASHVARSYRHSEGKSLPALSP